jgi:hemerythrin
MPLVTWEPSFSVKVKLCDNHHKKLFDLINTLHEAMLVGKGAGALDLIINELSDYTKFHFAAEEGLLEKAKYPALEAHRVEHCKFEEQVDQFREDVKAGRGSAVPVLTFIKDWVTKHIRQTDQRYSAYLNSNGVS